MPQRQAFQLVDVKNDEVHRTMDARRSWAIGIAMATNGQSL